MVEVGELGKLPLVTLSLLVEEGQRTSIPSPEECSTAFSTSGVSCSGVMSSAASGVRTDWRVGLVGATTATIASR